MIAWGALVLAAVGISLLVALPGTLLLAGGGAGRMLALSGGPAVTVAIAGMAAVVFSRIGIVWDARTASGLLVLVSGFGVASAFLRGRRRTPVDGHSAAMRSSTVPGELRSVVASIIGAVTAGGTQIVLFAKTVGTPWALLQNTDAMVQLNLIEEIHRSGDASMLTAAIPVTGGSYPTAWHSFSVFLTPFADTPFAFNALLVSLFGVLYPAGVAMLAAVIRGGPVARVAAPWLATSTFWFPGYMLTFNSQVSGGFAVALLPFAIGAVVLLWRNTFDWRSLLLGATLVLGVGLASPGAGQWAVLVTCVLLFVRLLPITRLLRKPSSRAAAILGLVTVSLLPAITMMTLPPLRSMGAFSRDEVPFWSRLLNPFLLTDPSVPTWPVATSVWACVPLCLLGVAGVLMTRRTREPVVCTALAVTVACIWITGLPEGPWWALVGGWWRDYPRFLAIEVICLAACASIALEELVSWFKRRLTALHILRAVQTRTAAAWLLSLVLIASMCIPNLRTYQQLTARGYVYLVHPPWITAEEAQRMETVGGDLPQDAVVYGFPQSGAGLIPVLTAATSVHRSWSPAGNADQRFLAAHFDELGANPKVCEVVRRIGGTPYYYEDSDISDLERWMYFPGYDTVDLSVGFELVAVLGTAHLYRITACD